MTVDKTEVLHINTLHWLHIEPQPEDVFLRFLPCFARPRSKNFRWINWIMFGSCSVPSFWVKNHPMFDDRWQQPNALVVGKPQWSSRWWQRLLDLFGLALLGLENRNHLNPWSLKHILYCPFLWQKMSKMSTPLLKSPIFIERHLRKWG